MIYHLEAAWRIGVKIYPHFDSDENSNYDIIDSLYVEVQRLHAVVSKLW